ncbi:hypothetical protein PMAYCL1PPCAC_05955, partial [Pristionchus mayeri]
VRNSQRRQIFSIKQILHQAAQGLEYLHQKIIVHRDLKPDNLLISVDEDMGKATVRISDFGIAKKTDPKKVLQSSGRAGSDGWIAPEARTRTDERTFSSDIFSLELIFFYVLTNGGHPYGDLQYRRQTKIFDGEPMDLEGLDSTEDSSLSKHLISLADTQEPSYSYVASLTSSFSDRCRVADSRLQSDGKCRTS